MPIKESELISTAVAHDFVSSDDVEFLKNEARKNRTDLMDDIICRARIPVEVLYQAVAERRGLPFVDLTSLDPDLELLKKMSESVAKQRRVLPLYEDNNEVVCVVDDPDNQQVQALLQRVFKKRIQVALTEPNSLSALIDSSFLRLNTNGQAVVAGGEGDAVELLNKIMKEAYLRRATDIHFEPQEDHLRVRFRINGRLLDYTKLRDLNEAGAMISRIKVLANLDISEQRFPQDGGFTYETGQIKVDTRVATIPILSGERVTIRLLGTDTGDLTLKNIGLSEKDLGNFEKAINSPHGMILLTGPTGSGKSTTLYAAIREILKPDINIVTVENPVEYIIPNISQVNIGGTNKVDFPSALRSLLRHDPDVLMIGEIRDTETSEIAVRAAMTGHLVFSTLHTNTAISAVTRLKDLGCPSFLVGSTLNAVIAQRLVRQLCSHCKTPRLVTPEEQAMLGVDSGFQVYEPQGCVNCFNTGFRSRLGIFESLWITPKLRELISSNASEPEIYEEVKDDLKTLRTDGYLKVHQGLTTIEEVNHATMESFQT